jgi:hypothetical protein
MKPAHRRLGDALFAALLLSAPAFAYTASGVNDADNSSLDNPGLDVTRHAMPPPEVTAKPPEAPAVVANPLWGIPLSALTATRSRPLFTPSRRPPAPFVAAAPAAAAPPPPPPAVSEHPNLTLVGTVATESEGLAVFIDTATRDAVRLRTGEGHAGWILQSVERRTATLQKGTRTETLALPKPGTVQAAAPVITALPPPPPPPPQEQPKPSGAAAAGNAPQQSGGCMPEPIGC